MCLDLFCDKIWEATLIRHKKQLHLQCQFTMITEFGAYLAKWIFLCWGFCHYCKHDVENSNQTEIAKSTSDQKENKTKQNLLSWKSRNYLFAFFVITLLISDENIQLSRHAVGSEKHFFEMGASLKLCTWLKTF